ncbi:hypothetical protein AVEN_57230-1 [Araneus ventricosus]|uniref:Uncharacterized protein n=1 Tax=Araneus ventricosus TaxID=182803 RepID=A0A4Y2JCV6_ARAVE|nr:hypothetical protein AVEN_57230-1 [Araneus ventricosus]
MDKVRLLPSGVQGLVPTEAALSSFTMNRSPIVLDTAFSVGKRTLDLVQLRTKTSGIRNNNNNTNEKETLLDLLNVSNPLSSLRHQQK